MLYRFGLERRSSRNGEISEEVHSRKTWPPEPRRKKETDSQNQPDLVKGWLRG